MRGDAAAALDHLVHRAHHRGAAHAQRARAAIAPAGAEAVRVAREHVDPVGRHAEARAHDLREGRLVALAHRGRSREQGDGAVGIDPELGGVGIDRGVRPARHLDGIGDAEPEERAALARLRAPLLEPRAIGEGERHVHAPRELPAVVGEDEPGLERHRRRRDDVPAPELDRVDAELARGQVDHALDGIRRLGPPRAAIRTRRRRVREDAGGLHADGRRRVHAGEPADIVGARPRASRREIRADIEPDGHAQAEEPAVGVERQLGRRDVVAAVLVGDEGLAAVGRPSDGPPQPLRRPEHQRHLRVHAAAHAEAAADLARHHAHVALRHAQDVREDGAAAVRSLDARVQRVAGRAPVVLADGGAGLERRGRHAGDREVEPGHVGRRREGAIDGLAGAGLPDERDIVGRLVPDRRRARAPGIGRRGHRGQRLVLDVHQGRGVGRLLSRLRDHQDDGIADVADPPAGQRRTRRGERRRAAGPLAARVGGEIAEPVGGQIGLGPHREHTRRRLRRRGVDADDPRMRMGRAHDRGRRLPRQPHVIRVPAEALEEAHVLDAAHRLSDGVLLDGDGFAHGVPFYRVSGRRWQGDRADPDCLVNRTGVLFVRETCAARPS